MNRLTKKVGENYCSQSGDFYDLYNKLGKLEDLMEKYEINSVEEIENKIKRTLNRWLDLLETDGINSKSMVANDIQAILKEIKK